MKASHLLKTGVVVLLLIALVSVLTTFGVNAENAKNDYAFDGVHFTRETVTVKVGGSYTISVRKINAGSCI